MTRLDMSLITKLPLSRLTTSRGNAVCLGEAGSELIRSLLQSGVVRFVIADVGAELSWVPEPDCFDIWKTEVMPHLAEPQQRVYLEQFPGGYAYFASRWDDGSTPIVLLSKAH